MMQRSSPRKLESGSADLEYPSLGVMHHDVVSIIDSDVHLSHCTIIKPSLNLCGSFRLFMQYIRQGHDPPDSSHGSSYHFCVRLPLEFRFGMTRHDNAVVQVSFVMENCSTATAAAN